MASHAPTGKERNDLRASVRWIADTPAVGTDCRPLFRVRTVLQQYPSVIFIYLPYDRSHKTGVTIPLGYWDQYPGMTLKPDSSFAFCWPAYETVCHQQQHSSLNIFKEKLKSASLRTTTNVMPRCGIVDLYVEIMLSMKSTASAFSLIDPRMYTRHVPSWPYCL